MHDWNVSVNEAAEIQKKLRSEIQLEKLPRPPKVIAGVDVSNNRFSNVLYAGFVSMTFPDLVPVEQAFAELEVTFPYVPGFLSFREIPALLKAFEKLKTRPDLLCVDGQGIAHPRRMGIAAHLGLVLDIPSVGFAKSVLYGEGSEPAPEAPAYSYLKDSRDGQIIGAKVRTKTKTKPMIVSPGHRITIDEAAELCILTRGRYRIPEPTRRAHEAVNAFRRGEK